MLTRPDIPCQRLTATRWARMMRSLLTFHSCHSRSMLAGPLRRVDRCDVSEAVDGRFGAAHQFS